MMTPAAWPAAVWKGYLLGGVYGAAAHTVVAPVIYAKLAIQVQDVDPRVRRGEVPRYRGLVDCCRRVYREDGIFAFYRGHAFSCFRYFPTQMFNLCAKDFFKKLFPKYDPKTEFFGFFTANLLSGGLAAAAALAIVYPLDAAKDGRTIDLIRKKPPQDISYYMKQLIAKRGVLGLWTGIGVSIAGIVTYRGLQLGLFDKLTGFNPWKNDISFLGIVSTWAAAQVATNFGAFVTYPWDTLRRRLQWQQWLDDEDQMHEGPFDCAKKILQEEGMTGFYKGFGLNLQVSVLSSLILMAYDKTRRRLGL